MTSAKKKKLSEEITEQLRGSSTATIMSLPLESTGATTQQVQINRLFMTNGGDEPQVDEKPMLVLEKNGTKVFVYL